MPLSFDFNRYFVVISRGLGSKLPVEQAVPRKTRLRPTGWECS